MWANAQHDGHPAEYRYLHVVLKMPPYYFWNIRPMLIAAKFGSRPLLKCLAVTLPKYESARLGG